MRRFRMVVEANGNLKEKNIFLMYLNMRQEKK